MESERTPLRSGAPAPNYVFMTNPNRVYRTKIRQFQCCVCAAILTVFVAAVVMTVSYSVNHDSEDDNGTIPFIPPSEQLNSLLKQTWPLSGSSSGMWTEPAPSPSQVTAAIEVGQASLMARDQLEAAAPSLDMNSPSYKHTKAVGTSPRATELARAGFVMDMATKQIVAGRRKTPGGSVGRGPKVDADFLPEEVCRDSLDEFSSCPPTPYRSVDGSCNNMNHPLSWGVGMRPFRRTITADYADGVSDPRVARDGSALPSAREVSVTVHRPLYKDDPDFTVMLAVWGQFIDHDITATALSQKWNGKTISCCRDGQWSTMKLHPECFPVQLSDGDPFYHTYNLTCMEFVRSAPAPTCSLGAREQLNQASSFLDGSVVYGNTPELSSSLRRFMKGELRMLTTEDGRTLLPISEDPNDGCNRAEMNAKGRYCFLSGDSRANENMHLTSMHLLWARQHNAFATRLAEVNPSWDDERLYQEARRIVSAQMEHITYNEFLPILLGDKLMEHLELAPKKTGYYGGYDETVDPSIANSFAASAFRFAHTLLPSLMKVLANDSTSADYVEMHKILFNPYLLYQPGYLDGTLKGLMDTDVLKVDPHVSSELSQHLFESANPKGARPAPCGLDLVSLNIQRGRDHGLPSYPNWREHCGYSRPTCFADLAGIMDEDSIERISTIYKSVDDIDMYTGMLSEIPLEGGIIGPTITCVLADQFVRLKKGDRYWYENSQQPQAFTPEQLDEIRKTSLAKVLCDTSDSVGELQRQVMRSVTSANPRVSCSELPELDLIKWREVEGSFVEAGIGRVKMAGSKVHIVPPVTAARLSAAAGAGEPGLKTLAVGATVMGGRISSAGGTAWSGQLPLAIPVPLFDTVDTSGKIDANTVDPSVMGHGILWEGTLSTDSYGYANFEGRFSMPRYIHGNGIQQFAVKWLSGDFSFYTKLTWDSTRNIPITVSGKYSSPVYLQERPQYQYLRDPEMAPSPNSFYDVSSGFVSNPALQNGPGVYRSPCILHGAYSADKKTFLWTGNITLIVPNAVPYDTWANYWSQTNEIGLFKRSSWLTSSKSGIPAPKTKTSTTVGVTVTSGSVTASSGGSESVTWWDGKFPVAIPVPIFNRVLTASAGSGTVVFGTGVSWSGSSTSSDVSGSFSLPIYVHGPGPAFSIQWWEGNFSLQIQSLWNATLDGAFSPGITYTSPIYLRAPKSNATAQTVLDTEDDIDDHPTLQLLTASGGSTGLAPKVPIILHGNYTPDKTQFYWSGNVTFILPTAPPMFPPLSNQIIVKSQYKSRLTSGSIPQSGVTASKPVSLGMTVEGGHVSSSGGMVWSGQIPVAIPLPLFDSVAVPGPAGLEGSEPPTYGHGILWTGAINSDSSGYVNMEGTFSMPRFVHGNGIANFSTQWLSGDFVLYTRLIWNSTTGYMPPWLSGTYSSPVFLRATKQYEFFKDTVPASVSGMNTGFISNPVVVNGPGVLKAPLILHGTYSSDKTAFIWSGNMTVVVPNALPVVSSPLLLKSVQSSPAAAVTPASPMAVGVSVTTGSVIASSEGSNTVTWWNGTFPAALPVPLFNRVLTATPGSGTIVFGSGISWNGCVTSNGAAGSLLSGSFSLPIYNRGPGTFTIEWWTGNFSLQYIALWNATLDGAILPGVTYTSPVYFRQAKSADSVDAMIKDYVFADNVKGSSVLDASVGPKVPIILHGNYSPDKTQFYWQGNATFLLPLMPPSPTLAVAQMIVKTSTYGLSPEVSVATPLVLGGTVVSGYVSSSEGSVWSGELPVAIPLPLFDSVATAGVVDLDSVDPPAFGHGILWDGTMTADSSGAANFQGTYSVPKYIHGGGLANFSIQWLNGNFMFNSRLSWNSSLNMPTSLAGTYSSPIYLRAVKEFEHLKYTAAPSNPFSGQSGGYLPTPGVVNDPTVLKAPLILLGAYSLDKTMFIWSGNYSLIIPNVVPSESQATNINFQKSSLKTSAKTAAPKTKASASMAVGARVTGGSITASSAGSTPVAWWSGSFPAVLPVPLFNRVLTATPGSGTIAFGSGISWSGSVTANGASGSVLSGTFSLPVYARGLGTFSVEWWAGNFSLQYTTLWNATLDGAVSPGVIYTSPVYFRQAKSVDTVDAMMKDYDVVKNLKDTSSAAGAGAGGPKVPIILHGNYTPDKTQFYWFGNVTLLVPLQPKPKPAMLSSPLRNTFLPTKPARKPLALGATVLGGHISTTSGSAWSGGLPMAIPLPLFDSVSTPGEIDTVSTEPPVYGHGILWDGTVSTDSSGYANFQGRFSMPKYIHGNGLTNFTMKWLSGTFLFYTQLVWNSTVNVPISVSGTYSSPVYLQERLQYQYLKNPTYASSLNSFSDVTSGFTSQPTVMNGPEVFRSPCILHGIYSDDRKTFLWSGNFTLIIPNAIPWPSTLYYSNPAVTSFLKSAPRFQLQASFKDPVAAPASTAVGLSVTSGTVSASLEGSDSIKWWDGTLPVALPVPLFNKVVTAPGASDTIVFGSGVSWSESASSSTAGASMLNGIFSLPIYIRGPGTFSIQWCSGNFSFQAHTVWNTTLDSVLQPGVTYSSPIYLRVGSMAKSMVTDLSEMNSISGNPALQFITSAKGALGAEPKAPVILYGTYSPDKTQFWWSGNATLMVPPPSPAPVALVKLQKKMASGVTAPNSASGTKVTLGGTVTSGSVVASSDSSGPTMWWNGQFPVAIQSNPSDSATNLITAPPVFSHGISWQGSLTKTSLNEVMLQGTFSMPQYTHGGGLNNFSIEWFRGQFSFQMNLLWDAQVDGLVSSEDTFSSAIYLQPVGMKNQSELSFLNWDQPASEMDSNLIHFISKSEEILSGATQVPVVLQGSYSPDHSVFWWTGNVLVSFPAPVSPQSLGRSFVQAAKPSKPAKPVKVGKVLGVTVVSGSIVAGLEGVNPTVWWDGQLPLSFPLPAKDSLSTVATAPALAQDITWTGMLVNDSAGGAIWEGQFSLPSFDSSNGVYTYSAPMWTGQFSFKLSFLWATSFEGLVKPGVTYTAHVRLVNYAPKKKSSLLADISDTNDEPATEPPTEPTTEAPAPSPPPAADNTKMTIMLRGYLSPDKTTFQWIGSAIISFPFAN